MEPSQTSVPQTAAQLVRIQRSLEWQWPALAQEQQCRWPMPSMRAASPVRPPLLSVHPHKVPERNQVSNRSFHWPLSSPSHCPSNLVVSPPKRNLFG